MQKNKYSHTTFRAASAPFTQCKVNLKLIMMQEQTRKICYFTKNDCRAGRMEMPDSGYGQKQLNISRDNKTSGCLLHQWQHLAGAGTLPVRCRLRLKGSLPFSRQDHIFPGGKGYVGLRTKGKRFSLRP
jgi:hypothetical protein